MWRAFSLSGLAVAIVLFPSVCKSGRMASGEDRVSGPLELFEQRIMPIFRSPKPSSCVQCHLSDVDLRDYILSSSEDTFCELVRHELVDPGEPQNSKILQLIAMGEKDADAGARLIHARTRQAEYEAFAAWIEACCKDRDLIRKAKAGTSGTIGPTAELEVVRYNRKDRLLDSFVRNIWSQRMRCFPCHTPAEIDVDDPRQPLAHQRHAELVAEYGQRMNLFRATPAETMRAWMAASSKPSKKHLPLLNSNDAPRSLLVLKPTAKLPAKLEDGTLGEPSSLEPVSHGGGLKMHVNDPSYKSFVAWIEDYGRVLRNEYAAANQLPADNWIPSPQVLRITNTPDSWLPLSAVQVFVFAWDNQRAGWTEQPVAFTQSVVTPRRMLNGTLILLGEHPAHAADSSAKSTSYGSTATAAAEAHEPAAQPLLPAGRYLLRACPDRAQQLSKQPSLMLDWTADVLQTEVQAEWKVGFKEAQLVDGSILRRTP